MKFLRGQTSVNFAKLKAKDLQELKFRKHAMQNAEAAYRQSMTEMQMLQEAQQAYEVKLIGKYKLRRGKNFTFDLGHGYIHRPGTAPWETKKPVEIPKESTEDSKNPDAGSTTSKDSEIKENPKETKGQAA